MRILRRSRLQLIAQTQAVALGRMDTHIGKRHESDADLFMQRSNARFMFRRSDTMQIYSVSWRLRNAPLIEERFFPCRENGQPGKPDETRKLDMYPTRICR